MEISRFPKLRTFRRINGYSRKKVARVLGHADTSILSRWERGIVIPGILQAFKLARIYRTLPQILFDDLWNEVDKDESLLALADESSSNNEQMDL